MPSRICTTGISGNRFKNVLARGLQRSKPKALGLAIAYVSVPGFNFVRQLTQKLGIEKLRLVVDTRDAVTHPKALAAALDEGWEVKVIGDLPGTFHPKLYIGGNAFDDAGRIEETSIILVGSANLSWAALNRNGECSFLNFGQALSKSGNLAWEECWNRGAVLSPLVLAAYEQYFAGRNRKRSPDDLIALGVADTGWSTADGIDRSTLGSPSDAKRSISNAVATTAWAGLESFTGDYNLQVEFPRDAGAILSRIISAAAIGNTVSLACEDGAVRQFIFRYYNHNGMFRLNIPNSAPDAVWARAHKYGVALVELSDDGVLRFKIVRKSAELREVVGRSLGLGTWGRTPTRLYGWF